MGAVVAFRRKANSGLALGVNSDTSPAFFVLADQQYVFVNALGARISGVASGWLDCGDWFAAILTADRSEIIRRWCLSVEERRPISMHYSLNAPNSKRILAQALPQYSNLGEYLGHCGWLIDATGAQLDDMKEAYFVLLLSEKLRRERHHRRVRSVANFGTMVAKFERYLAI